MSESEHESRGAPGPADHKLLIGFVLGLAADVVLFLWMRAGPLLYQPADRGERGYSDAAYFSDVLPRVWYGLAFILATGLVGAVLMARRRTRRVGEPLLFMAVTGAVVLSCIVSLPIAFS